MTGNSVLDPLRPVGSEVGPPFLALPTDTQLDWDLRKGEDLGGHVDTCMSLSHFSGIS